MCMFVFNLQDLHLLCFSQYCFIGFLSFRFVVGHEKEDILKPEIYNLYASYAANHWLLRS